ncbi:hypothetical protein BBBOND_0308790 [Babesia bigemina]|uniref:Ribosome-binding protein 1 n=1 Tax=Babesia bigemina TaxID=5866 RepID=A0A061D8E9_BABBI|nr:hypothetical protein BBBOND_0308790 [Babesia bigemina]CDR96976.1 hypothetical protein BBBOND_0308790 [Babesia bigemina]|eukprot:XP_012769162.1 hypothetical protein BBBOND_0308790 [Babesia bigemina]
MAAKSAAGATAHGVPLGTLKECLQFLEWLNSRQGGSMQRLVSGKLATRIGLYYNNPTFNIQFELSISNFLRHSSLLYKQISRSASPGNFGSKSANDITAAFSECLSKVHSAFSYLRHNVDYIYGSVGGGRLAKFQLNQSGDNELKTYLTANDDLYNGIISGGFDEGELNNIKGELLVHNLMNALERQTITPDVFTSVLFNNLEKDDWHKQDAGNVLLLLWAFCEYVETHEEGGDLKNNLQAELQKKGMCFDWGRLVAHCKVQKQFLDKLFGNTDDFSTKPFTTTGRAFTPDALKPEAFAGAFEKWFENHWDDIGEALEEIKMGVEDLEESTADFSPESLYPYGIVLNNREKHTWRDGLKNLPGVLNALVDSGDKGLATLKDILGGEQCPKLELQSPQSSPKAATPPVATPAAAKPVATKTEATKPVINKAGLSPNQNNGQSERNPATSSDATSPQTPSSTAKQAPAPAGTKGEKGLQGSSRTEPTKSPGINPVQKQTPSQPQPVAPPPAPAPGPPAGPGSPSQPGDGSGSQNGGGSTGQEPAASSHPAKPPTTSVQPVGSQSSGASGTGSGPGPVDQGSASEPAHESVHEASKRPVGDTAAPTGTPSGSGGGGNTYGCSKPITLPAEFGGGKYCPRNGNYNQYDKYYKTWSNTPTTLSNSVPNQDSSTQHNRNSDTSSSNHRTQHPLEHSTRSRPHSQADDSLQSYIFAEGNAVEAQNSDLTFPNIQLDKLPSLDGHEQLDHSYLKSQLDEEQKGQELEDQWNKYYADQEQIKTLDKMKHDMELQRAKIDELQHAKAVYSHQENVMHRTPYSLATNQMLSGTPINSDGISVVPPTSSKHQSPFITSKARSIPTVDLEDHSYSEYLYASGDDIKAAPDPFTYYYGGLAGHVVPDDSDVIRQRTFIAKSLEASKQVFDERRTKLMAMDKKVQRAKYFGGGEVDIKIANRTPELFFDIETAPKPTVNVTSDPLFQTVNPVKSAHNNMSMANEVHDDNFEITTVERFNDDDHEKGFKPMDLSFEIQNTDPFESNGVPPIPPEVLVERADRDTTQNENDPNYLDLQIGVPDRTLQDSSYDIDVDDPPPPPAIQPLEPVYPSTTAISVDFPPIDPPESLPNRYVDPYTHDAQTVGMCIAPWMKQTAIEDSTDIPETGLFPSQAPRTVRDMLQWLAGLKNEKHHSTLRQCIDKAFGGPHSDPSQLAIPVNGSHIRPGDVFDILQLTAMFAGSVLSAIAPNWKANVSSRSVKSKSSEEPDCCALLCQLRDYVYACHHQLEFLKAQCKRDKLSGGWQNCNYGSEVSPTNSPLHAFLTDGWDCDFKTHPFDPCNLCLKSRIRMGFRMEDLPNKSQSGSTLSTILTPSCGGSDPLLTLSSYLNCLTRRTPRTTGELVSFFHNFGIELHGYASESLSPLGTAITKSHTDCPEWDCLGDSDLGTVRGIRGSESLISKHNSKHDIDHPRTLSTLVGCGSDPDNCHPHCSPITYRAYALYSQRFAHTYLSWTVYLPDRLRESLEKLHHDLKKHDYAKCSSLYLCSTALPLLYLHGFTPPEVGPQTSITCLDVIGRLKEIVNGKPIADLISAMDDFLYNIREPFIYTIVALWSTALLIFANTMLYRLDVLHIRSHLIRTKASHVIDVKALLTKGRNMLSLYKDVDYFDEDPIGQLSY